MRWVANIEVANEIIAEQGDKLDGATDAIVNLQAANKIAAVTLSDALANNNSLTGKLDKCTISNEALTAKVRKLIVWATIGKTTVVIATVIVALFVVKEVLP